MKKVLADLPTHYFFAWRPVQGFLDKKVVGVDALFGRRREYNAISEFLGSSSSLNPHSSFSKNHDLKCIQP